VAANANLTVCHLADVPDGDARGYDLVLAEGGRIRVIVARQGERAFVYRNRCPHRGTPLDWMPDRFLDAAGEHLICATHGALFRIEDGVCIAGPCAGDGLEALAIEIEGGEILLPDA
jgi:nitrite reductase/ring-hydroxylating ferredoxin subunit